MDEYVSDPEPSGAVCGLHHGHGAAALHGGRPAIRELPARRAGLRDRSAERGCDDRRADFAASEGGELGHGFRFRREADRRLSAKTIPIRTDVDAGNKRVLDAPPLHMGGYQQLLRGEPFRAKFRNSWEKPEPLVPGKETDINFTMPDLFHTFRRGHRIMVQVQSSWFPLTDRNPQTFTDIPYAKPEDFQKATEQVFHQKDAASGVEVLVMP